MGVPIHGAATEPGTASRRTAARPASNARIQASRVSSSVPSTSNRPARIRGMSGLLLSEPPQVVADIVERLDRLPLLLAGHRLSVHDRPADGERSAVLLVADPHDVSGANRRVRLHNPWGHHVGPVVDEPDRPHVDGHPTLGRGKRQERAHGRSDLVAQQEDDRFVPAEHEAVGARLRLVDRGVVLRDGHPELIRETAEEVRDVLASKPRAATDLQGHADLGMRPRKITLGRRWLYLSIESNGNQSATVPSDRSRCASTFWGSSRIASSNIFLARAVCPRACHAPAASSHASESDGRSPSAASKAAMASFGRPRSRRRWPFLRYARSRPSDGLRIAASWSANASSVRPSAAWMSARRRRASELSCASPFTASKASTSLPVE